MELVKRNSENMEQGGGERLNVREIGKKEDKGKYGTEERRGSKMVNRRRREKREQEGVNVREIEKRSLRRKGNRGQK